MKLIKVNLKKYYPNVIKYNLFLTGIIYDKSNEYPNFKRGSVLILPGGGYQFISYREQDPIMFAFLAEGINAFTLSYSVGKAYPIPHTEVACAMDYINSHAEEYDLIPNTCSLVGFSAGGHLAATYGYLYKRLADNKEEERNLRPYALILGYPVISLIKSNNPNCRRFITGGTNKFVHLLSADEHVSKNYPPTFIFTTKTDQCVNYKNTKWLVSQLNKKNVKNKCIIYADGPHGLALANHATARNDNEFNDEVSGWVKEASKFLFDL